MATITFDIVEKVSEHGANYWRIIGSCPVAVAHSGGLHVYAEPGQVPRVLECETGNEVLALDKAAGAREHRDDILERLACALAARTGLEVHVCDEATWSTDVYLPGQQADGRKKRQRRKDRIAAQRAPRIR